MNFYAVNSVSAHLLAKQHFDQSAEHSVHCCDVRAGLVYGVQTVAENTHLHVIHGQRGAQHRAPTSQLPWLGPLVSVVNRTHASSRDRRIKVPWYVHVVYPIVVCV